MVSPIEICSLAAIVIVSITATIGIARFYIESRRFFAEIQTALHKEAVIMESVITAANHLSTVVRNHEVALKNAVKHGFSEAVSQKILVVRTASAVEAKNKRPDEN
jgi:hypothetical protein